MSDRNASRVVKITRFPIATMADVLMAIGSDPDIGPRQREARRSAVKTFCRWLDKADREAEVSAELRTVRRQMATLIPAQCTTRCRSGKTRPVSKGRRANVFSLLTRTLLALRADLVDTRRTPLLPEWDSLFAAIGDPTLRRSCGRFGRWCSAKGTLPAQVTQQHAEAFAAELADLLPSSRARQAFVGLCRAWNRAAAEYPLLWPQVRLEPGDRRRAYVMPRDQIDPQFLADLEHMLQRFGSWLDLPDGLKKPFARRTLTELRRILLRLYTVALRHHRPTPDIRGLADLVRPAIVRSVLGYYLDRFGVTDPENTKSAAKYAHFLYLVAKCWAGAPPETIKFLYNKRATLTPKRKKGMAEKNRRTLHYFKDEARSERLLLQGEKALAVFLRLTRPSVRDALALQLALAIAMLIAAPVRSQNLASIHLERHLIWGRDGPRETCHLVFPASEVKNDIDLEFRLPPWVIEILKVYLAKGRPLLAKEGNAYLFPGHGASHKGPGLLSKQIKQTAEHAVGVPVTAHQFRHLVGLLYLLENPGGHEVVRRLLGHKRIETTIAHYAGMEQAAAIALWDRHIEARRQRIVRRPPRPSKPPVRLKPAKPDSPPPPRTL
jgi:integrase